MFGVDESSKHPELAVGQAHACSIRRRLMKLMACLAALKHADIPSQQAGSQTVNRVLADIIRLPLKVSRFRVILSAQACR